MGNLYIGCVRFLLAFVFLIPAITFCAESIPADSVTVPAQNIWRTEDGLVSPHIFDVPGGTRDQLCDRVAQVKGWQFWNSSGGASTGYCYLSQPGRPSWDFYVFVKQQGFCQTGTKVGAFPNEQCQGVLTCPAGYTLNGTMCDPDVVCPPGTTFNEISQSCRCDNGSDIGDDGTCCPQPGEALAQMQKCEVYSTSATSCNSSNSNGCAIRCNKVQFQIPPNITGGDGVQITDGIPALGEMCKYTGSKANAIDRLGSPLADDEHGQEDDMTKPKPPPKTPEGCMASGMGYVQSSTGATTCVKAGSAGTIKQNSSGSGSESGVGPGGPKPGSSTETNKTTAKGPGGQTTSTETVTTNNSDGSKTVKTTETKCINGQCESTVTTETKDSDGNVIDRDEKTESSDKEGFCTKNPNDIACKKQDSKFGGDCESGFVCEGDAATCGIAHASWRVACDGQKRGELNDIGDAVISGTDGKTVDDVPSLHITLQQLPSDGAGGSCPALPPLPGGYTVDMDQHCGILQGLGNAGVALALLMAGFIVIGGVRGL